MIFAISKVNNILTYSLEPVYHRHYFRGTMTSYMYRMSSLSPPTLPLSSHQPEKTIGMSFPMPPRISMCNRGTNVPRTRRSFFPWWLSQIPLISLRPKNDQWAITKNHFLLWEIPEIWDNHFFQRIDFYEQNSCAKSERGVLGSFLTTWTPKW